MNLLKYGKLQVDPAKLSETVNVRMQQGQRATILSDNAGFRKMNSLPILLCLPTMTRLLSETASL